jgi:hypothetical protein
MSTSMCRSAAVFTTPTAAAAARSSARQLGGKANNANVNSAIANSGVALRRSSRRLAVLRATPKDVDWDAKTKEMTAERIMVGGCTS